jgi:hypothetical protein
MQSFELGGLMQDNELNEFAQFVCIVVGAGIPLLFVAGKTILIMESLL